MGYDGLGFVVIARALRDKKKILNLYDLNLSTAGLT
jgi:hypothetical protein